MTRRKISKRQRFRIQKLQEKRLERAQKKLSDSEAIKEEQLGPESEGLLVAHHGVFVDVESEKNRIYRCNIRQNLGPIVAGDRVIWRQGKKASGVVEAVCQRTSLLAKPDDKNKLKPIAANINQIIIVIAPEPAPNPLLIDSYLVAAETVNIKPLILLNKIDLLQQQSRDQLQDLLTVYGNIGYEVLLASTQKLQGLSQLKNTLKSHASIFVGQSGVGKSSLINNLIPHAKTAVSELKSQSKLGKHTTTTSKLYHLFSGGDLIDSPGIREFGLWHMDKQLIEKGFIEFREFIGKCKFRDCSHTHEPECAILQAVKNGKIAQQRLNNFHTICEKLGK